MADNLKKASNYCVICSSNSKKNPQISFFRFPKDEKRCNEWKLKLYKSKLDNCSAEDCYKRYRVCSAHFEDCMFSSIQKNKLKLNAIPTRLIEVELDSISQPKASENIPGTSDILQTEIDLKTVPLSSSSSVQNEASDMSLPSTSQEPNCDVSESEMADSDTTLSGLHKNCNYCGKKVTKKVKCATCDAVFHNSCSQRKICCEKPALCIEKTFEEDGNLGPNGDCLQNKSNMLSNEEEIDVQKILFENSMLRKMLCEAESKHKILEYNIILLQENKKLLEEKLVTIQKTETQQIPIVDKNWEDKTKVNTNKNQPRAGISKQINRKVQDDTTFTNKIINENKRTKNEQSQHSSVPTLDSEDETHIINDDISAARQQNKQKLERTQKNIMNEVINLNHDQHTHGNEEFQTVFRKRRNHKLGKSDVNFTGQNVVSRKIWLFLTRIPDDINEEIIKQYIFNHVKDKGVKEQDIEVNKLNTLTTRQNNHSFIVGVPPTLEEDVYKPSFWPRKVGFERFDFRKGNRMLKSQKDDKNEERPNSFL